MEVRGCARAGGAVMRNGAMREAKWGLVTRAGWARFLGKVSSTGRSRSRTLSATLSQSLSPSAAAPTCKAGMPAGCGRWKAVIQEECPEQRRMWGPLADVGWQHCPSAPWLPADEQCRRASFQEPGLARLVEAGGIGGQGLSVPPYSPQVFGDVYKLMHKSLTIIPSWDISAPDSVPPQPAPLAPVACLLATAPFRRLSPQLVL